MSKTSKTSEGKTFPEKRFRVKPTEPLSTLSAIGYESVYDGSNRKKAAATDDESIGDWEQHFEGIGTKPNADVEELWKQGRQGGKRSPKSRRAIRTYKTLDF